MTKSIKKIFAALLVVATLALMIPFSASAEGESTVPTKVKCTVNSSLAGKFQFDFYQIATINPSTGLVTPVPGLPTEVKDAIKADGKEQANSASIISACKSKLSVLNNLDSAYKTTWNDNNTEMDLDKGAGIFYVHPVAKGVATKANDSLIVTPSYDTDSKKWIAAKNVDLTEKVSTDTIQLNKEITNSDIPGNDGKMYTTKSYGDIVSFKLTASVPGSDIAKLKEYDILDQMDNGLTFDKTSVEVAYEDGTPIASSKYEVVSPYTFEIDEKTYTYTFGIKFKKNNTTGYIDDIYNGKKIVVKFNATVNKDAEVGKTSNDNTVSLHYANDDVNKITPGPTVQVFAFKLKVSKIDNTTKVGLAGAKFELRKENDTKLLATAVSDNEGNVVFQNADGTEYQLAAGKYVVTETEAPEGYVLPTDNETTIEIKPTIEKVAGKYQVTGLTKDDEDTVVDNELAFVKRTITNVKITVPQTGGMGTTLFTICGASLIVLAGVMFVVLKRKKTSK